MRKRSPLFFFILLILTNGLMGYPWAILLAKDVNAIEKKKYYPIDKIVIIFIVLALIMIVSFYSLFSNVFSYYQPIGNEPIIDRNQFSRELIFDLGFYSALCMIVLHSYIICSVYKYTLVSEGRSFKFRHVALILALYPFLLFPLVLVQRRMNLLIERKLHS